MEMPPVSAGSGWFYTLLRAGCGPMIVFTLNLMCALTFCAPWTLGAFGPASITPSIFIIRSECIVAHLKQDHLLFSGAQMFCCVTEADFQQRKRSNVENPHFSWLPSLNHVIIHISIIECDYLLLFSWITFGRITEEASDFLFFPLIQNCVWK